MRIEPILGLNFEKIDLRGKKKSDFGQKKLPIIFFLISLKNVLDLRSFANASTHFILVDIDLMYLNMRYRTDPIKFF